MTTPAQAAERTGLPVLEIGRAWMLDPTTAERAAELGLDGPLGFWVIGRTGALGEVSSSVAAGAIGICSADFVDSKWRVRSAGQPSRDIAEAYAEAAAAWGRRTFAGFDEADLDRLDALTARVVDAADPSIGILFAGWKTIPVPADAAGRVTVRLNVLREMRGGAHLSAIHAVGLGPLGAIISTDDPVRGGPVGAERWGWPGPYPDSDLEARAEAETLTNTICTKPFTVLDEAERTDMVSLILALRAAMD